jgi:hypothetical protein
MENLKKKESLQFFLIIVKMNNLKKIRIPIKKRFF